jgi:hypothetical protein
MNEKQTSNCFIYEWQESQFLNKTEIILSIARVHGVHKILHEYGKPLYLVPESCYLAYKKQLASNATDEKIL